MKQRRSYFSINEDELKIYRYETMPIKWLKLGGTLRSSFMNLDVTNTNELNRLLNIMIETIAEDKKGVELIIGDNPYETFYFSKKELYDLSIDTILAIEYGLAYKELREYKEEIYDQISTWEMIYRLENKICKKEKYRLLLGERARNLNERIDMNYINAKLEVRKMLEKANKINGEV